MKKISSFILIVIVLTRLQACYNFKGGGRMEIESALPEKIIPDNTDEYFVNEAVRRNNILNELISIGNQTNSSTKILCSGLAKEIKAGTDELQSINKNLHFSLSLTTVTPVSLTTSERNLSDKEMMDRLINCEKEFEPIFKNKAYSNGDIEIRAYALRTLGGIEANIKFAQELQSKLRK